MNYYSSNISISAPVSVLQEMINSGTLSKEAFIKYCEESIYCILCDYWPPIIDTKESVLSLAIYTRGCFRPYTYQEIVGLYPSITIDVNVNSMGVHCYHLRVTYEGAFEVYDEYDLRNEIEDFIAFAECEKEALPYELAYQYMVPECRKWTQRLGINKEDKVFGDIIPFPEDLVPDKFKSAWHNNQESFKSAIIALVASWKSLDALCDPKLITSVNDNQEDG